MATLDYTYQDYPDLSTQLSIQNVEAITVDHQTEPNQDLHTPTNQELDQELEELLGLMDNATEDYEELGSLDLSATVREIDWVNPDKLVDPVEFNYQTQQSYRCDYERVTNSNNKFNYQVDRTNNPTPTYSTQDRYNYQASSTNTYTYPTDHGSKFDYSSTTTNDHCNYQPSDNFNYQSNTPKQFDQFDYQPNQTTDYPSHTPQYSSNGSSDQAVLDVEVDSNTRIRLEVGASVEVSSGSAMASAYAKATVYRRK